VGNFSFYPWIVWKLNGTFARAGHETAKVRGFGGGIPFERSEYGIPEEKDSHPGHIEKENTP
jgi:hypothetical protein